MSNPFRKPQPGEPLSIPAKAYGAMVDAAKDYLARQVRRGGGALTELPPGNVVLVKNTSGAARNRFDVLGIDGPIFTRGDNDAEFKARIALTGSTPAADTHAGRFVVLLEPAIDGVIARAWISGVCVVRVEMNDEAHTAADVADGDAGKLSSAESGAAALLWIEPVEERDDPAIAWCVVRFGGGGGGSSSGSSTFLAHLTHVQQCESVAGLPEYHWLEAQLNGCVSQAKSGGRTSDPTYTVVDLTLVGSSVGAGQVDPDAPQLVFPAVGSTLPGTVTPGSPDTIAIEFEWTAENGGGSDTYFLGVGEPPHEEWPTSTWDIYQEENTDLGDVQTHEVTGIPTDGRTIAIRVWNATRWNDYTFKVVRSGGGLAVGTEDLNALARGDDVPEPAEYGVAGWIPATKTELTTPIRAIVTRSIDADGKPRYVFVRGGGAADIQIGEPDETQEVVTDVDFDEETCELTVDNVTFTLAPVTINGESFLLIRSIS